MMDSLNQLVIDSPLHELTVTRILLRGSRGCRLGCRLSWVERLSQRG
jgi:hypothetical protein